MDQKLFLGLAYVWILFCGWAKEKGHSGPEFWIAAVSPLLMLLSFVVGLVLNIIFPPSGIVDVVLIVLYLYFFLPIPGMTWLSQALKLRRAYVPSPDRKPVGADVTSAAKLSKKQSVLVQLVGKGEWALSWPESWNASTDFDQARSYFQQAMESDPPEGPITEWPHTSPNGEWKNCLPTRSDVLLGFGISAIGVGNLEEAHTKFQEAGYPFRLPVDPTTLPWDRLAPNCRMYSGSAVVPHWLRVGVGQRPFFHPAAVCMLEQMFACTKETGDLTEAKKVFEFLDEILAIDRARGIPEFARILGGFALDCEDRSQYALASYFIQRGEMYVYGGHSGLAIQGLAYAAISAARKGRYSDCELLMKDIEDCPYDFEFLPTETEARRCEMHKLARVRDVYEHLAWTSESEGATNQQALYQHRRDEVVQHLNELEKPDRQLRAVR